MSTATVLGGTVPYHFIPPSISAAFDLQTNDTVIAGAGSATYYLSGSTTLLADGGTGSSLVIAEGQDSIFGGDGNIVVTGGSDPLFFAGGGGDAIVTAATGNATLFGGSGTNLFFGGSGNLTAYAGTGPTTVAGGSGATTFNGVAGKHEDFITGSGTAAVTVGSGCNTIIGGTGASTITAATGSDPGHDVFSFIAGHGGGKETILNFNGSTDKIEPIGYGSPPPVENLTGGNDVITLNDGTQITLVGVDQKVL